MAQVLFVVVLLIAAIASSGCQPGAGDVEPCGQLPDVTGCPSGRGGTCDDPECSALYDCLEGQWERVETCNQMGEGGAGGGGGQGGAACMDPTIDTSGQASGCPGLQLPDCPVEAANTCQPCLTGCTDFLYCEAAGWFAVAYCDEDGQLIVTP